MKKKMLTMTGAGVATLALALTGCAGGGGEAADGESLTHVEWGGASQEISHATLFEPFGEEAGVQISQDQPTDYAKIDAMVDAEQVSWGVVEVEPNYTETACAAGTLTPLTDEIKQTAEDNGVDPELMHDCAIPIIHYAFTIGYNTDTFSDAHPTTWEEFFDTETFPGKRGFWSYATGGVFEAALLADGVAPEDLYPLDLDRAFAKLDTIKDDIVWYDTGDEQIQLVSSGEAPLVQAWNGRIFAAENDGQPVANEYNENFGTYEHMVIPNGYPNTETAQEWMTWVLENPEAQADYARESSYGPITPAAFDHLSDEEQAELSNSPENVEKQSIMIDYSYWAENYADVSEQLNVWMVG